jgi:hypothetical protein
VITLVRGEPDPEDGGETTLSPCAEVIELFSFAVNARLLASGRQAPRPTQMECISRETPELGAMWRFHYRTAELEPASFLVLLALLAQTKYAYAPLAAVTFAAKQARSAAQVAARDLLLMPREAPIRVTNPPFLIEERDFAGSPTEKLRERAELTVTYNFLERLSPARAQEIMEGLNLWDHLAVLGGFCLDFVEQDDLSSFGELAHVSPYTIEHRIPQYEGWRCGFSALVNYAAALHACGPRIRSVELAR